MSHNSHNRTHCVMMTCVVCCVVCWVVELLYKRSITRKGVLLCWMSSLVWVDACKKKLQSYFREATWGLGGIWSFCLPPVYCPVWCSGNAGQTGAARLCSESWGTHPPGEKKRYFLPQFQIFFHHYQLHCHILAFSSWHILLLRSYLLGPLCRKCVLKHLLWCHKGTDILLIPLPG